MSVKVATSEHTTSELAQYRKLKQNNEALNREELRQGKEVLRSYPPLFQIDLIGVCDMKPYCRMCTIDMSRTRAHGGMAMEQIETFEPFVEASHQVTNCSTGEPLLHRDLEKLLDFTSQRGTRFGFSCNGLALDAKQATRLLGYGDRVAINFSLDGATAETYAKVRCNDFDRVLDNIRRFCAGRLALPEQQRPEVGLCFIPMRLNVHEVPAIFDLARELEVDHLELRPLIKLPINKIVTTDGFTFNYEEQMLSWPELEACHEEARQASERTGIRLDWQYATESTEEEDNYILFRPKDEKEAKTPCSMPWTFLLPYENGDTVPCCYMSSSIGNWREEGLENVWNGETLRSIRRALAQGELAEECWKSASCPVVKRMHQEGAEQRVRDYLVSAQADDGEYIFQAGDAALQELIDFGVFEEERAPDGRQYRWIADHGRLELPNPYPGQPFEISLRLVDGRSSAFADEPAPICHLRVNDTLVGSFDSAHGADRPWIRTEIAPSERLRIDFEFTNTFVPGKTATTNDTRVLGAVLDAIHIRPALSRWTELRRQLGHTVRRALSQAP